MTSFPLETFDRILHFAFSFDKPLSARPPLPCHLSLVSRAFDQLSQRYLWHAVSVTRTAQWLSLFGPEGALFERGDGRGTALRSRVKDLAIDLSAHLPVELDIELMTSDPLNHDCLKVPDLTA